MKHMVCTSKPGHVQECFLLLSAGRVFAGVVHYHVQLSYCLHGCVVLFVQCALHCEVCYKIALLLGESSVLLSAQPSDTHELGCACNMFQECVPHSIGACPC